LVGQLSLVVLVLVAHQRFCIKRVIRHLHFNFSFINLRSKINASCSIWIWRRIVSDDDNSLDFSLSVNKSLLNKVNLKTFFFQTYCFDVVAGAGATTRSGELSESDTGSFRFTAFGFAAFEVDGCGDGFGGCASTERRVTRV
jgi:hypothetical protein